MAIRNLRELNSFIKTYMNEADKSTLFDQEELSELRELLFSIENDAKEPVRLSFCGNFSVGKSMIINSLLGEDVAPTNVRKTTAIVCHFRYGDTKRVRFHYRDGKIEEGNVFAFKSFADHQQLSREHENEIKNMSHVEVFYPSEVLREITIIDTPGFGSDAEKDDSITREHLKEADAVCWVFDANEVGKGDEVRRIESLSKYFRATFAVINKCDEIPDDERPDLKNRIKQLFPKIFRDVYLYSATTALESFHQSPDGDEIAHLCVNLVNEIQQHVKKQADSLRIERAMWSIGEYTDEYLQNAQKEISAIKTILKFLQTDFPQKCQKHGKQLLSNVKRRRDVLKKDLEGMFAKKQGRFKKCIRYEELNEHKMIGLYETICNSISDIFSGWQSFITMEIKNSFKAMKAYYREVSDTLTQEWVEIWEQTLYSEFESAVDDFFDSSTAYLSARLCSIPREQLVGVAGGFSSTTIYLLYLDPIAEENIARALLRMPCSALSEFLSDIFEIDSELWRINDALEPDDGKLLMTDHVDRIIKIAQKQASELKKRKALFEHFMRFLRYVPSQI